MTRRWNIRRANSSWPDCARVLLLATCLLAGCRAPGRPDRVLVISMTGDADILLPPLVMSTQSAMVSDLIFERLAEPDSMLEMNGDHGYQPRLADAWTWAPDSLSIAFHLDRQARWHDGAPVTAGDVHFTHALYRDSIVGASIAPLITNIDSVTTPDSVTAVFWFRTRSPQQFFDATYQMRILPAHLLDSVPRRVLRTSAFARAPVGSGPFRFRHWTPRAAIELVADSAYHRGRPKVDRVIFAITSDPHTALARVLAGEADVLEQLAPADVARLARRSDVRLVPWSDLSHGILLFNLRAPGDSTMSHSLFSDRVVRRAMTMALDRERLVASAFGSTASVARGPLPASLLRGVVVPQIPHDAAAAARLLDDAGWRRTARGVRRRDARALEFTLLVPSTSSTNTALAAMIQAQLHSLGAVVHVEALDFTTFIHRLAAHRFDAALLTLDWDPSPATIRQLWTRAAITDGSNFGGYVNPAFDAVMDSATMERDPARVRTMYERAWTTLTNDAPAIWLYDVRRIAAVRERVHPASLRADAWWANLAAWTVASSQ